MAGGEAGGGIGSAAGSRNTLTNFVGTSYLGDRLGWLLGTQGGGDLGQQIGNYADDLAARPQRVVPPQEREFLNYFATSREPRVESAIEREILALTYAASGVRATTKGADGPRFTVPGALRQNYPMFDTAATTYAPRAEKGI